jgi:murein L,D-transpeptidase YafK
MWEKNLAYFFILGIKNLQFRYSTWKRSKEIAKAYGSPRPLRLPPVSARTVIIIAASIAAAGVLYMSAPAFVGAGHLLQKLQQEARGKNAAQTSKDSLRLKAAALPPVQATPPSTNVVAARPEAPDTNKPVLRSGMISKEMNFCLLANKSTRMLYLLSINGPSQNWTILNTFPILVGRNDGQKVMAGDNRTPEGTYFIIGRKETEELNAIYGPLAYVLNYPNEDDRKAGRTGQGIWIHGTREDTTREATRGCVVLDNNNLITLADYLQLGIGTPVIIVNMPSLASPERFPDYGQLHVMRERILNEYDSRQTEFSSILSLWKKAWESRDIDEYSQFYDPDRFLGEGMHWDSWREKKIKTFKAYSMISISMEKICVSEFSESTAVVLFIQQYTSDVFHMQKPKKLSFVKSDGRWKIFREETFSRQELLL